MGIELEFVINRDNAQKIKLSDNSSGSWTTADLSDLSRAILVIGELEIDSSVSASAFVLDDNDGTITIKIGAVEGLIPGIFDSHLIIYRTAEPNGIRWKPSFKIRVLE